ncbi:MAG: hypothetical protein ACFFB0_15225 [Promethearchaeota archaeon]
MLLDGIDHRMMEWMFSGDFNWLFIIGGAFIFFILIIIIVYALTREKHQPPEEIESKLTINQNLGLYNNVNGIKDDILNFCPNCGEKIDRSDLKFCPNCGSAFKRND